MNRRIVARLDSAGDVLLAGPAVRAVAASGGPVTLLTGPAGADAGAVLPGVDEVRTVEAPWVPLEAGTATPEKLDTLLAELRSLEANEAIVLTSFHQSPLPLAVLLRMAGVERIAATSVDHAGGLLDVRHPYLEGVHEVEQSLSVCAAAGHRLPLGDDGSLEVVLNDAAEGSRLADRVPPDPYVVVHPGASVPARGLPLAPAARAVAALERAGYRSVLTGSRGERAMAEALSRTARARESLVLAGETTLGELGQLIAGAAAVVCGNTGPAHLAAAVGTPVVEAFAPTVDPRRWHPWRVPHVLLGVLDIACAGCRSRTCPIPGQPCLEPFTAGAVVKAVSDLSDAAREGVA